MKEKKTVSTDGDVLAVTVDKTPTLLIIVNVVCLCTLFSTSIRRLMSCWEQSDIAGTRALLSRGGTNLTGLNHKPIEIDKRQGMQGESITVANSSRP